MPRGWFHLIALIALGLCLASPASAQVLLEVNIGWEGRFCPDRWTPVIVSAQADRPTPVIFKWYVPRPGRESMVIEQSVTLNIRSGDHFAYLPIGPDPAAVHLTVSDARTGRTLAYWPTEAVSPMEYADAQVRQPVFIGVSGEGPALQSLKRETYAVAYLPPEHLPRRAIGYDGLDLLALNQPQIVGLEPQQQHAIAAWVRGGGRLLLWLDLQALPEDSPLMSLIPGGGVAEFTARDIGGASVPYTRLENVPDRELVTRASHGLGEVIFLHVPPDTATAAGANFLPTEPRPEPVTLPTPPAPTVAEAEAASADGTLPLSLLAVAVLVGPVDWLVLRRSSRRMRRWITLPGWLAVFALLIWYLPADPTPKTWAAIAPAGGGRPPVAAVVVATTGSRLMGEGEAEIAQLREIGRPYWRTIGFARTEGPLRDLTFFQGDDGMTADDETAAFVADGTAFAE